MEETIKLTSRAPKTIPPGEVKNGDNCPICKSNLRTEKIPEKDHEFYGIKNGEDAYFSKLIAIELDGMHPNHYDGVSYYQCPHCKYGWNRFSGEVYNPSQLKKELARI